MWKYCATRRQRPSSAPRRGHPHRQRPPRACRPPRDWHWARPSLPHTAAPRLCRRGGSFRRAAPGAGHPGTMRASTLAPAAPGAWLPSERERGSPGLQPGRLARTANSAAVTAYKPNVVTCGCCNTYMRPVAEQVHTQLVSHPVVALVISKLNKGEHFLDGGKCFQSLIVSRSINNGLTYFFKISCENKSRNTSMFKLRNILHGSSFCQKYTCRSHFGTSCGIKSSPLFLCSSFLPHAHPSQFPKEMGIHVLNLHQGTDSAYYNTRREGGTRNKPTNP